MNKPPVDIEDALYDLAPVELPMYRVQRYHGDDLALSLSVFTEEDRGRLKSLYGALQELFRQLSPQGEEPVAPRVLEFLCGEKLAQMRRMTGEIGHSSYAARPSAEMAKTIHDLRGGALTPLLGQLQLAARRGIDENAARGLFHLTRDHLKIMRNALLGLDDLKRAQDLLINVHSTDLIIKKWHGADLHEHGRDLHLEVDCPQVLSVGECCTEFAAIDRIFYNLISNACRHASFGPIRLVIFPVPKTDGRNVRFVLLNTVSSTDLEHLRSVNMKSLFEEGTSTTGSGYGLAIASDFVSHAYGLRGHAEATAGGYLGAALLGDTFAAWFHWPRVFRGAA